MCRLQSRMHVGGGHVVRYLNDVVGTCMVVAEAEACACAWGEKGQLRQAMFDLRNLRRMCESGFWKWEMIVWFCSLCYAWWLLTLSSRSRERFSIRSTSGRWLDWFSYFIRMREWGVCRTSYVEANWCTRRHSYPWARTIRVLQGDQFCLSRKDLSTNFDSNNNHWGGSRRRPGGYWRVRSHQHTLWILQSRS